MSDDWEHDPAYACREPETGDSMKRSLYAPILVPASATPIAVALYFE